MHVPIPSDLESAARCLEARFRLLGVPTRTVAPAEWDAARVKIPSFLSQLLEQFSLLGGVLEYRDRRRPYPRLFSFASPTDLASFFDEGSLMKALVEFGYFPFAKESDGSMWVTGPKDAEGPVFLLELPEWNGQEPTPQNGLVFACERLSFLIGSMAVSEASYYATQAMPRCVMWYSGPEAQ